MNLLKSTQLQKGGWHYTVTNDGHTRAHICCYQHDLTPHATAEEADRCKYEYELSRARTSTSSNSAHKCLECGEWTPAMYIVDQEPVTLCPEHQTLDLLRKHHPFKAGIQSWES